MIPVRAVIEIKMVGMYLLCIIRVPRPTVINTFPIYFQFRLNFQSAHTHKFNNLNYMLVFRWYHQASARHQTRNLTSFQPPCTLVFKFARKKHIKICDYPALKLHIIFKICISSISVLARQSPNLFANDLEAYWQTIWPLEIEVFFFQLEPVK